MVCTSVQKVYCIYCGAICFVGIECDHDNTVQIVSSSHFFSSWLPSSDHVMIFGRSQLCHFSQAPEWMRVWTNKLIVTSQMNHHMIWIGWQQGCKHVSRTRPWEWNVYKKHCILIGITRKNTMQRIGKRSWKYLVYHDIIHCHTSYKSVELTKEWQPWKGWKMFVKIRNTVIYICTHAEV